MVVTSTGLRALSQDSGPGVRHRGGLRQTFIDPEVPRLRRPQRDNRQCARNRRRDAHDREVELGCSQHNETSALCLGVSTLCFFFTRFVVTEWSKMGTDRVSLEKIVTLVKRLNMGFDKAAITKKFKVSFLKYLTAFFLLSS